MAKPTKEQQHSTSPLDAAYVRATGRQSASQAYSWTTAGDWTALPRALIALEDAGGAVMLGRTRDGGQLTVAIYYRGEKNTHYFDNAEQALDYLEGVSNIAGAL
jgi:hypothetical protein